MQSNANVQARAPTMRMTRLATRQLQQGGANGALAVDMAAAMAETVSYVDRSRAFMPPGTLPRERALLEAAAGAPLPATGVAMLAPRRTCLALRLRAPAASEAVWDEGFLDFLAALLVLDPSQRPSARQALRHPWMLEEEAVENYTLP